MLKGKQRPRPHQLARPPEVQLRADPPAHDVDFLARVHQRAVHRVEVHAPCTQVPAQMWLLSVSRCRPYYSPHPPHSASAQPARVDRPCAEVGSTRVRVRNGDPGRAPTPGFHVTQPGFHVTDAGLLNGPHRPRASARGCEAAAARKSRADSPAPSHSCQRCAQHRSALLRKGRRRTLG